MSMIEINRNPSKRELLWFGVIFLAFWIVVAAVLGWRFDLDAAAMAILGIAAVVTIMYSAVPPMRRPLYLAWMYAAAPIGWILSHLLLAIIYYLVFTPVAIVMRLIGRDPLRRRFDANAESYWIRRSDDEIPSSRYFRQF